jgi:hypothetical protein
MSTVAAAPAVAHDRPVGEHRWDRAAATLVLAAAAVVAWWPVLGSDLLLAVPIALVAALVAGRALPIGAGVALLLLWVPAALLLAGVGTAALRPHAWGHSLSALVHGGDRITVPENGGTPDVGWSLAAALLLFGVCWVAGATVAAVRGYERELAAPAVLLLAVPFAGGVLLRQSPDAGWEGAVLVAAALLWLAGRHVTRALVLSLGVLAAAALFTQAVGPHGRWLAFGATRPHQARFHSLDPTQTYGPLTDRRTGAAMLSITSPQPALWRMEVLDQFDGHGWSVAGDAAPTLAQPAAVPVTADVETRGLRQDLIVSPGTTSHVDAPKGDRVLPAQGEATRIVPPPTTGQHYRVTADVVHATPAELRAAPAPTSAALARYRTVGGQVTPGFRPGRTVLDPHRELFYRKRLRFSVWGQLVHMSDGLAYGERSEYGVVQAVQRFLTRDGIFHYTTDVPRPSPMPVLDFLLWTHVGYCQQFAGAAALLLRMAGVPTRVVVGFATGLSDGPDRYTVRDKDAHAWIEVYFPNYGWVPFNPTPSGDAGAPAATASEAALLSAAPPAPPTAPSSSSPLPLLLLGLAGLGGGVLLVRRHRRRRAPATLGDVLARVAARTGAPIDAGLTLGALGTRLRTVGPHVAALAREAERDRFDPAAPPPRGHPWPRVARALRQDVGVWRTIVLLRPATRRESPRAPLGAPFAAR